MGQESTINERRQPEKKYTVETVPGRRFYIYIYISGSADDDDAVRLTKNKKTIASQIGIPLVVPFSNLGASCLETKLKVLHFRHNKHIFQLSLYNVEAVVPCPRSAGNTSTVRVSTGLIPTLRSRHKYITRCSSFKQERVRCLL